MTRDRQASQPSQDPNVAPGSPLQQVDSTLERHRLEQVLRESGDGQCTSFTSRQLRALNRELEQRVIERTAQLSRANQILEAQILERQRVEEALRQSEACYRAVVEDQTELICRLSADGTLTFVNEAYCRYFGKQRQELIGKSFLQLIPEAEREAAKQHLAFLSQTSSIGTYDYQEIAPSGEIRWQQWTNRAVFNTQGELIAFQCVGRDITERKQAKEALRRQLAAVEAAMDGIATLNSKGEYLYLNEAHVKLFGYSQSSELVGKTWHELYYPDEINRIEQDIFPLLLQKGRWRGEAIAKRKDGSTFFEEVSLTLTEDGGLICVCRDIIKRKQSEEQLRWKEALLRSMTSASPLAFYVVDDCTDGILYFNHRFCEIWSIEHLYERMQQGKLKNNDIIANCLPLLADVTAFAESYKPLQSEKNRAVVEDEIPLSDGRTIRRFSAQIRDESDRYFGRLYIFEDVTDRKRTELEIKEAKERFELVIRASQDGFWDWNLLSGEIYFSPRWKEMIGYGNHELPNEWATWEKVIFEDDRTATLKLVEDYNSGCVSRFLTTQRFHHKNGSTVHILSRAIHLKDSQGRVVRMIGAHSDITELVNVQEALQALTKREREKATQLELALQELQHAQAQLVQKEKMASLGQLVAGVAHEINNPTSFIYGNINPAMEYAQDLLHLLRLYQRHYPQPVAEITQKQVMIDPDFIAEDFPKLLISMKEGAERIAKIVLSLRNFSRLDEKELKRVDIHEGIDNTLLILQHRLKQQSSRPEIQVIKEYGQLPLVECYASQLNQVFMNLLCNAIDALEEARESEPERCGMIRIRTEAIARSCLKGDRPNLQHPTLMPTGKSHRYPMGSPTQQEPLEEMGDISCVVIHISDNGPGIRAEAKPRLFDPFFTTKPPGKGTGLGLSISYQIVVDKHKGQLLCHSAAGLGTEFVVELPIAQCKAGGNCEA